MMMTRTTIIIIIKATEPTWDASYSGSRVR